MNKTTVPPPPVDNAPPIDNAADYIDALTRPRTQNSMVKKKVIAGRRMRDKYRDEVVLVEVVKKLS